MKTILRIADGMQKGRHMLQKLLMALDKAKATFLAAREDNPAILTGDYDVKLSLRRKEDASPMANAAFDGKVSAKVIDLAVIFGIFALIGALGALFSFAGYLLRKIFD